MQFRDEAHLRRTVGRRIGELRALQRLTQEEFAESFGVSPAYIRLVEAGRQNLTLASLFRFAKALRVPVQQLFVTPLSPNPRPGRPRRARPRG